MKQGMNVEKFILRHQMDLCHLKNFECEPQFQKH